MTAMDLERLAPALTDEARELASAAQAAPRDADLQAKAQRCGGAARILTAILSLPSTKNAKLS